MKRYDTYKDSGVQWLGEIPSHWQKIRLNKIFRFLGGYAFNSDSFCDEETKNQVLRIGNVKNDYLKLDASPAFIDDALATVVDKFRLKANTILFTMTGTKKKRVYFYTLLLETGNMGKKNLFLNQRVGCFIPISPKIVAKYYCYLFKENKILDSIFLHETGTANQGNLGIDSISRTTLHHPPLPEQQAIVTYLDSKCSKIDQLLANKEKEIALLQEMKQRVIADAVTRGLNPDVKMKATGISWLPEVPEHWEIKPIRAILKENTEKSETGAEALLSLSQYTGVSYKKDASKVGMFEAESTVGYKMVHSGQFVMNIMLAWNGSYAVSNLDGIISPAYCVFDFISECDKMYFHYLWRLGIYQGAFKTASRGIIDSRLRLYPNKFLPFPTICPPLSEQQAIVSYINERVAKIDTLAAKLQKEIESIKEYKQRLISDVVTGQIKVC